MPRQLEEINFMCLTSKLFKLATFVSLHAPFLLRTIKFIKEKGYADTLNLRREEFCIAVACKL